MRPHARRRSPCVLLSSPGRAPVHSQGREPLSLPKTHVLEGVLRASEALGQKVYVES